MQSLHPLLARNAVAATCCAITLSASPATADVLEIGVGGDAHWVSGPLKADNSRAPPTSPDGAIALGEQQVLSIPGLYADKVSELSARYDLSPALIEALVWQESRWHPQALSPAGARGLAQLMPGTARELGVDAADPMANLEGGARYLRAQLDRFDGNIEKALAAYNAGPGRVVSANGVPAIRETQSYVASIMGRLSNHVRSDP